MSQPEAPKQPETPKQPEAPEEQPEELRIGVFVCHCGLNIAGTVDVHAVAEYAKTIPDVVYVKENPRRRCSLLSENA
jgi:heterodisulfide reductase subunit A